MCRTIHFVAFQVHLIKLNPKASNQPKSHVPQTAIIMMLLLLTTLVVPCNAAALSTMRVIDSTEKNHRIRENIGFEFGRFAADGVDEQAA